jgi:predicted  nucleic acid-binding Zn-ribbon protein
MAAKANELTTTELVDEGLDALKARDYRYALELWEEVHRRHPDHPRAKRLVRELQSWLERRNTVKPRTSEPEPARASRPERASSGPDLQRVERRIKDLEKRLDSTIQRKNELLDEINELHAHYRKREDDLTTAHDSRVHRLTNELSDIRKENEQLRGKEREATHEIARLERERDDAQLRANELQDAHKKAQRSIEDLRARLEEARQEREGLRNQLAQVDREELDELREIARDADTLRRDLREARLEADSARQENEELQRKLEQLQQQQSETDAGARETIARLEAEVETLREEKYELQQAVAKSPSPDVVDELEEQRRINDELMEQIHSVEQRLARLVPRDDDVGHRARQLSDSFDISGLVESADELREEFVRSGEETHSSRTEDAPNEESEKDISPLASDEADTPSPYAASSQPSVSGGESSDPLYEDGGFDQVALDDSADDVYGDDLFPDDDDDDDLSHLLGSSLNELLDDDDDFVDLESDDARKREQEAVALADEAFKASEEPDSEQYSGEFEALLLDTPQHEDSSSNEPAPAPREEAVSIADQPDAVVTTTEAGSGDDDDLSPMSAFVLSRIDEATAVSELIDTMGLPAAKTVSCLEELKDRGLINVSS